METLSGSDTAVYVGQMWDDYLGIQEQDPDTIPQYLAVGSSRSATANRISHFFNLKGPSVSIDTACSSSLVALHQAVQTLRSGESLIAIAAGVNLILTPSGFLRLSRMNMLSPTGHCHMWDSMADGYARGEGTAVLILKTLSNALKDGDSIGCIIRETGLNQDGRTPGITMPSAASQAALIRATYAKAGLNCDHGPDQPQFFEAHGTGTQAGDPVEAEAVSKAFFSDEKADHNRLFVGSIKTVMGHTESTAGVAGILKAMLAMAHRVIPPNLHFQNVNPRIAPLMNNFVVPTEPLHWPKVPAGSPLRCSVNAFGFGGTNAHAIVESYEAPVSDNNQNNAVGEDETLLVPLVLSANSSRSLGQKVLELANYIATNPAVPLEDIAWTLQQRRSNLPIRVAYVGINRERLQEMMATDLQKLDMPGTQFGTRMQALTSPRAAILGVFTGQGAQWAAMGAQLLRHSAGFRSSIAALQETLSALPDGPSWPLADEMMAVGTTGPHNMDGVDTVYVVSAAVTLSLMDVLHAANVRFAAVVGHSGGEITAAYAAGLISRSAAMQIIYYRGKYVHLAKGTCKPTNPTGSGGMIAVGISAVEGEAFCQQPQFHGRIALACSNSPQSVTLSGDSDAIEEAHALFDSQGIFVRQVRVQTAFHGPHCLPVVNPYLRALQACKIQVQPAGECRWFPSDDAYYSQETNEGALAGLSAAYWTHNLVQTVPFSESLSRAVRAQSCQVAVEVGPHPALKGPATKTIKAAIGIDVPYTGVMVREENDCEAVARALGLLWTQVGSAAVDIESYRRSCYDGNDARSSTPRLVSDLPSYPWEHARPIWHESRLARQYYNREKLHELLGSRSKDDVPYLMRWRNVVNLSELPWIGGHRVEGQAVMPAAAYVIMAYEAAEALAKSTAKGRELAMIELRDINIDRAIYFDNDAGVELLFALAVDPSSADGQTCTAHFSCSSAPVQAISPPTTVFRGSLCIRFTAWDQPPARKPLPSLKEVSLEQFYAQTTSVGIQYQYPFLLRSLKRRHYAAFGTASKLDGLQYSPGLLWHPALLDTAFQTLLAAFSLPRDGKLWTAYLPRSIRRIIFHTPNPSSSDIRRDHLINVESHVTHVAPAGVHTVPTMTGDVDLVCANTGRLEVQVEGLLCAALTPGTPSTDRALFSTEIWKPDLSTGLPVVPALDSLEALQLSDACERMAVWYQRQWYKNVCREAVVEWHHEKLWKYLDHQVPALEAATHPLVQPEWLNDAAETMAGLRAKFPESVDMKLITVVGDTLPAIILGKTSTSMLEEMMEDDLLHRYYQLGIGFQTINETCARTAALIAHCHPRMKILEIGAGTGGTTKSVLPALGKSFLSYEFTDVSKGFFKKAQDVFSDYSDFMTYNVLDIEMDTSVQGYEDSTFDMIIASNVLHATKDLDYTMKNVRRLLKPGGYLLLSEGTTNVVRGFFSFSSLPGWWLSEDIWREKDAGPLLSQTKWDQLLHATGFNGISHLVHDKMDQSRVGCALMVSQAIDERMLSLQNPLAEESSGLLSDLVIIGGCSPPVTQLIRDIERQLPHSKISKIRSINDLGSPVPIAATVLNLCELDEPLFRRITSKTFESLKLLFHTANTVLWVTQGRRNDNPHAGITIGLARTLKLELPELRLQFLDIDSKAILWQNSRNAIWGTATLLNEFLLRLVLENTMYTDDLLWTKEPEWIYQDGKLLLPRVVHINSMNNRLNADRRYIVEGVSSTKMANSDVVLEHAWDGMGHSTLEKVVSISPPLHIPTVGIRVTHSVVLPVRIAGPGNGVLSVGLIAGTKQHVVTYSPSNASMVYSPTDYIMECHVCTGKEAILLTMLEGWILSEYIRLLVDESEGMVLINEPTEALAIILSSYDEYKTRVVFMSRKAAPVNFSGSWIRMLPSESERIVKKSIPQAVKLALDLSVPDDTEQAAGRQLIAQLPHCELQDHRSILHVDPHWMGCRGFSHVRQLFEKAKGWISSNKAVAVEYPKTPVTASAPEFAKALEQAQPYNQIFDWTSDEVAVPASTTNSHYLFDSNKTYILVGLTGELGQSLALWMVSSGVKYLVLASRSPKIDRNVLEEWAETGADVRVFAMDVTDIKAVRSVYDEVQRTMPPVAGLANGAMVLEDGLFHNMSYENFIGVLHPKVEGTLNLESVFANDQLDFFILFSGVTGVTGNRGQSAHTANTFFMQSLAAQRRRKGLVATAMDLSWVIGLGYAAGFGDRREILKMRYMQVGEAELHTIFSECILAGRVHSGYEPQVISGLAPGLDWTNSKDWPSWYNNPRFSHLTLKEQQGPMQISGDKGEDHKIPVSSLLAKAISSDEALALIINRFLSELEFILQLPPQSVSKDESMASLGVDSLIAVEVRAWITAQVGVDMPILKIVSDSPIQLICEDMYKNFQDALEQGEQLSLDGPKELSLRNTDQSTADLEDNAITSKTPLTSTVDGSDVSESSFQMVHKEMDAGRTVSNQEADLEIS